MKRASSIMRVVQSSALLVITALILQSCCFGMRSSKGEACNCSGKDQDLAVSKSSSDVLPATVSENKSITKPVLTEPIPANLLEKVAPLIKKKSYREDKKLPLGIKGIQSGLVLGPNISFKSSDEDFSGGGVEQKHKPGAGLHIGFGSKFYFSENFAVNTGLVYKQCKATETLKYSSTGGEPGGPTGGYDYEYKDKYSFNYLSVPLLAEYRISNNISAMAGPELNYCVGASVKSSSGGESEKTSLTDRAVKLGLGIQAGIRIQIPNSRFGVQVVYDQRISRLNEKEGEYTPGGGSYDSPAWKMKSIQVGVTCAICDLLKKGN